MRTVGLSLYHALRGGAAVIEGAEFLLTHRRRLARQIPHFLAAAACSAIATGLASRLTPGLPQPPALALPWYLVLIEWAWSRLPSVLGLEIAAGTALTGYLALAWPRELVAAVEAQRGPARPATSRRGGRASSLVVLSVGAAACGLIASVPAVGPAAAAALACPALGAGLAVATLTLHGWPPGDMRAFLSTNWEIPVGLGLGLIATMAIPVVNLTALPCALAGAACLLGREPRPGMLKTSEGTTPCASRDT